MKPSHRKDVIIARIIFAFICLALIGIIVGVVVFVSSRHKNTVKESQQTESQKDEGDVPIISDLGNDTENSQLEDSQPQDSQSQDGQDTESQTPGGQDGDDNSNNNDSSSDGKRYEVIESVRLREQPSTEAEILTVCYPGDPVKILSQENGWTKVEYAGQVGYVISDCIGVAD